MGAENSFPVPRRAAKIRGYSFVDLVKYLLAREKSEVYVSIRARSLGESGADFNGTLNEIQLVPIGRPPSNRFRCLCRLDEGNVWISEDNVESIQIDLFDPDTFAVRIGFRNTDFEVVIPDERIKAGEGLPGVSQAG